MDVRFVECRKVGVEVIVESTFDTGITGTGYGMSYLTCNTTRPIFRVFPVTGLVVSFGLKNPSGVGRSVDDSDRRFTSEES
jgi:hypothetical protein